MGWAALSPIPSTKSSSPKLHCRPGSGKSKVVYERETGTILRNAIAFIRGEVDLDIPPEVCKINLINIKIKSKLSNYFCGSNSW